MEYDSYKIILYVFFSGVVYFIVSNTLWILFGARFLQFLPAVGDKSFFGTLKLSLMIISVFFGIFLFMIKFVLFQKPIFKEQISDSLKFSSSIIHKLKNKYTKNKNK